MLSVIIPTYNRATLLSDAIDSLCKQDMVADKFEIIVVDNNSNDNTNEVVANACSKHKSYNIRYILEERQGDYFARNRGADEAKGDYLVFTDDDALFDVNYLSTINDLFVRFPQIGAVGTRISILWEGGTPTKFSRQYEYLMGAITHGKKGFVIWEQGLYINNGSLAINRKLYIELGGINPAQIGDYIIGDAEGGLCRKLFAKKIPIAFTDDTTMWHRQFVGKNDTIKDVRRRFENQGITHAYTQVIVNHNITYETIYPYYLKMIYYAITLRKRKTLRQYFKICELKKYNEYVDRYQNDEQLKQLINSNRYVFNNIIHDHPTSHTASQVP